MAIAKAAWLAVLVVGISCGSAGAADVADEWKFEVTPYMLAAGMDGTVGVLGHQADIDASFGDIWDVLDAGLMGLFTAQKGPWWFGLEGVYMKLQDDGVHTVTGPGGVVSINGQLDVTSKLYVFQASAGYRVWDEVTKVDAIGALRYTELDLDTDVDIAFTPPIFGGSASADGSEGWTDLVVGVRALHPVSKEVSLIGYADVGGGGSDLTFQFIGGVNWEFSDGFTAKLGYRYLSWDYEDDGAKWDVAAHGPYLGIGIAF